jgi:hypothetical protein
VELVYIEGDHVEMAYHGPLDPSWLGLTWAAQRIIARSDIGFPFKRLHVDEKLLCFLHFTGMEVRIRMQ